MRPIYKHSGRLGKIELDDSIDGYTENMVIFGDEIINICNDPNADVTQRNTSIAHYKIDTSLLSTGDWTIYYDLIWSEQNPHSQLNVSIGTPRQPSLAATRLTERNGHGWVTLNISQEGPYEETVNLHFWTVGGQENPFSLVNVMLVKGNHTELIPYFKGKQGLGKTFELISNNKNLIGEMEEVNLNIQDPQGHYVDFKGFTNKDKIYVSHSTDYFLSANLKGEYFVQEYDVNDGWLGTTKIVHAQYQYTGGFFTTKTETYYVKVFLKNIEHRPLSFIEAQLELGTKKTSYVEGKTNKELIEIPVVMYAGYKMYYDKDYHKMVIANDQHKVIAITKYYKLDLKTYNDFTLLQCHDVESKLGFTIRGSMQFDYPTEPEYPESHPSYLITLNSGDIIDTRLYSTWLADNDKKVIFLRDSLFNFPDKTIRYQEISKSIRIHD